MVFSEHEHISGIITVYLRITTRAWQYHNQTRLNKSSRYINVATLLNVWSVNKSRHGEKSSVSSYFWSACYIHVHKRLWEKGAVDPYHKSHNASDKYPTMHYFVKEMCTRAKFCYIMVYCGTCALWDLCNRSVGNDICVTAFILV